MELAWRAAERGDVLEWGRLLFPEKFPLAFCREMHGYFVDIADKEFTVTEAPRGHAKTTIRCFLIPLFKALNTPKAYDYYLNVQATEPKALAINRAIRSELEMNDLLIEMYGSQVGARWTDGEMELANGVVFKAVSSGESLRGLNYNGRRPRYIIVDDLYSTDDIYNQESTQKKNEWLLSELYPARAQFGATCFHLQGTAINLWDLLHVYKNVAGVPHRTFKSVTDWENKTVLWPELKNYDDRMAEKDRMLAEGKGSIIWFREYQNERSDDANAFIKRKWLYPEGSVRTWERGIEELGIDGHRVFVSAVLLGNDPSIGDKVENDYNGVVLVWVIRQTDSANVIFFIDNVWNDHLSLNGRVLLLQKIQNDQPAERKIVRAHIEGIAGFKDYVAEVKRRTTLAVHEVDRVKDKISNLESKSGIFESGRVLMNKNIDPKLKDALVYQLTTNRPNKDDIRDALFLVLEEDKSNWEAWA